MAITLTDTNGKFTVDFPPGTYTVTETNNPTYDGGSGSDGGDPIETTVDVTSDDSTNNVFVDEIPSVLGSLPSNVKGDDDKDDTGDTNLSGVPIVLSDSSSAVVATTVTDSNGDYVLNNLPLASYTCKV